MTFRLSDTNHFSQNPVTNLYQQYGPSYGPSYPISNTKQQLRGKISPDFNYQMQIKFIDKQKQWLKSMKLTQSKIIQNSIENSTKKVQSPSLANQNSNKCKESHNSEVQQTLVKTVKHINCSHRKTQSDVNPQSLKPSTVLIQEQRATVRNEKSQLSQKASNRIQPQFPQKKAIMSIEEIRQIQRKQLKENTIHKITSSASRKKLNSSSSKDSKGSANLERKSIKLNGNTQRYNKYLNNEIIDLGIDLRRQVPNSKMIINPTLQRFTHNQNRRIYHQDNVYAQKNEVQHPKNDATLQLTSRVQNLERKQLDNESLTCRQSIPRQDNCLQNRIKTRSKSNLSKYTQLKSSNNPNQCLIECNEHQKDIELSNPIQYEKHEKVQKSNSRLQTQKKIHALCYSSERNRVPGSITAKKPCDKVQISANTKIVKAEHLNGFQNQKCMPFGNNKGLEMHRDPFLTKRHHVSSNFYEESGQSNIKGLNHLIEQKIAKKPIRLTLQRKT